MKRVAPSELPAESDTLAESYSRWRSTKLGQITDRLEERLILELLGDVEGLDVLDVGCGDGALAAALSRRGGRVTELDPDPRMLDAARTRAKAESLDLNLVPGRAEALPFADETFDYVVAVTVLCFIPQADKAIAEMARVLRPGGRLVIGELGKWNLWATFRRIRGWLGIPNLERSAIPHSWRTTTSSRMSRTDRPRNTRCDILPALRSHRIAPGPSRSVAWPTRHVRRRLRRVRSD